MKKVLIIVAIIELTLTILLGILVVMLFNQPKFGKLPSGERLERIKKSSNYKDGEFKNLSETSIFVKGANPVKILSKFIFGSKDKIQPKGIIPSMKINLKDFDSNQDVLVWFGHSSYFIQIDGKKILVDPVLSGVASPVSFTTNAFKGTDPYKAEDIPNIDYLFITHDHWDHLDYYTIMKLKPRIKKVICGLGVGEHFEYWGFDKNSIIEKDWNEEIILDNGFTSFTVPSRHFSGRSLKRNTSLWTSYVFITPTMKFFFGCDGGYDTHFAEAGNKFGGFDLAILENGQYNQNWKYIHSLPDEVFREANELKTKKLLPIHSAKFNLSQHPWDEPLIRISELCNGDNPKLITPLIGELVYLKDNRQNFSNWWVGIK